MIYKMLVTDLDGTLLDSRSRLSERNKEALCRLQSMGIKTVISSGRSPRSLKKFEEQIGNTGLGCYGIGFNGSAVYETGTRRILQKITLNIPEAQFILSHIADAPADALMYINDMLYIKELNDNTNKYIEIAEIPFEIVKDFREALTDEPYKIILRGGYEELMPVYEDMKVKLAGRSNVFFSGRNLLEFTDLAGTKGNGLRFLAGYLGIDLSEIAAIGDNFNDIPMLEAAGLGAAVANAEKEVAARADKVTRADNNNNAIAELIEDIFWRN